MKKLFAVILTVVLVLSAVAAFAACKRKPLGDANFIVPEGGYDGEPVTITFYSSMGQGYRDVLNDYIAEFNELYPNITVEHHATGGTYDDVRDQVRTELSNGNAPNIAYCYADHVALYNRTKAVVQLDNLIASDIEEERADGTKEIIGLTAEQQADFIAGYYNEGKTFGDDKMYMMPWSKSCELMYYNKDFFADNGLEVPDHWFAKDEKEGTQSTDHTSMEYVIARIAEIDPGCTPLGYDSESNLFITLCEQFGTPYTSATGDHYLFNTAENRDMVKTLNRWYQNGWMTTRALNGNAYCSDLFKQPTAGAGKSYICIGSSAGAANQRPGKDDKGEYYFDVGITIIPQAAPNTPLNQSKVLSQGPSVCIFQQDNPQEVVASWLFVKFMLTNPYFNEEFANVGGYTPVIKSTQDVPEYAELLASRDGGDNIAGLAAWTCMEQEAAYFTSPVFYGSSVARDQVGNMLTACLPLKGNVEAQIKQQFDIAIEECEYAG